MINLNPGAGWQRTVALLDLGPAAALATATFDHNGAALASPAGLATLAPAKLVVVDVGTALAPGAEAIEATSSGKFSAAVALTSGDRRKFEIVGATRQCSTRALFPVLLRGGAPSMKMTLFNSAAGAANLTVIGRDSRGLELQRKALTALPGKGSRTVLVADVFTTPTLAQLATIEVVSDAAITGVQFADVTNGDIALLPALDTPSTRWTVPIFVRGTALEFWTSVGIFNPSAATATATVEAFDSLGNPLGVIETEGIPSRGTHVVATANFRGAIPPNAGFIKVSADQPVNGYLVTGVVGRMGVAAALGISGEDGVAAGLELIGSPDGGTLAFSPLARAADGSVRSVEDAFTRNADGTPNPALNLLAKTVLPAAIQAVPLARATAQPAAAAPLAPAKTFIVNSAADTDDFNPNNSVTTFREALRDAGDGDTIQFNISGPAEIFVDGSFGSLGTVRGVMIDATTQAGSRVILDGSMAGSVDPSGREISGFEMTGAGATFKGFAIRNFAFDGVVLRPSGAPVTGNNIVADNFIHSNGRHGVHVTNSANNHIGGTTLADRNIITQNKGDGVHIDGKDASKNFVQGNRIGTDPGSPGLILANDGDCVFIDDAPETTVGDPAPVAPKPAPAGASNVLVGKKRGVCITGLLTTSTTTKVNGNFFGLDNVDATLSAGLLANGSLFVAGGNVMTKISDVQIQAFVQVDGGIVLRGNKCLSATANEGVEFTFKNGSRVTVEATENVILARTGIKSSDSVSGQFVWKSSGNQITSDGPCYDMLFQGDVQASKDFNDKTLISGKAAFMWTAHYASNVNLPLTINAEIIRGATGGVSGKVEGALGVTYTVAGGERRGGTGSAERLVVGAVGTLGVNAQYSRTSFTASLEAGLFMENDTGTKPLLTVIFDHDSITGNTVGIDLVGAVSTIFRSIDNCTITDNTLAGIRLRNNAEAGIDNNLIARNGVGILVQDTSLANAMGNTISSNGVGVATVGNGVATLGANSFSANTKLAIDLGNDGVTPNDPGDADGRQNFPVLTSAISTSANTTIRGTLNSTPAKTFTLGFFANTTPDPSGFGQGETFLGSQPVTTDASGNVSFAITLPVAVTGGKFISAIATNAAGNTSEFSRNIPVNALSADLALTKSGSPASVAAGSNVTYTIAVTNKGPDTAGSVVVTDNLPANTAFVSSSATGGGVSAGTGNNRTITFASLANGASATITLVAKISASAATGTKISNTATVSTTGAAGDPVSGNNSSTAVTTVAPPNQPPMLSAVTTDKTSLWPPNHKLVPVTVIYTATDDSGPPVCTLSVTSAEVPKNKDDDDKDEGKKDHDDGDKEKPDKSTPNWVIVDAHHVLLRAERGEHSAARIYTITVTCRDAAGLSVSKSATVRVGK